MYTQCNIAHHCTHAHARTASSRAHAPGGAPQHAPASPAPTPHVPPSHNYNCPLPRRRLATATATALHDATMPRIEYHYHQPHSGYEQPMLLHFPPQGSQRSLALPAPTRTARAHARMNAAVR
eukprot:scaffold6959_cov146-Isochrysis_galbana.AAC.4